METDYKNTIIDYDEERNVWIVKKEEEKDVEVKTLKQAKKYIDGKLNLEYINKIVYKEMSMGFEKVTIYSSIDDGFCHIRDKNGVSEYLSTHFLYIDNKKNREMIEEINKQKIDISLKMDLVYKMNKKLQKIKQTKINY